MAATVGLAVPAPAFADNSLVGGIVGGIIGGAIVSGMSQQNQQQTTTTTTRRRVIEEEPSGHPVHQVRTSKPHKTEQVEVVPKGPYLQDQADLAALGFYKGKADGQASPGYSNAVVDYKLSKGLAAAPVLSETERGLLHAEAAQKAVIDKIGDPNLEADAAGAPDERAQIALRELTFYDGPIGGGKKTKAAFTAAVKRWQASVNLPSTGVLSAPQTKQLMAAVVAQAQKRIEGINQQYAAMAPVRPTAQSATQPTAATGSKVTVIETAPQTAPAAQAVSMAAAPQPQVDVRPAATPAPVTTPPVVTAPVPQKATEPQPTTYAAIEPVDPKATVTREWDVAVIIGNQAYQNGIPEVSYGIRDAEAMRSALINRLGFSPDNVLLVENATQGDMATVFGNRESYKGKIWKYIDPDGRSKVFVFYSGHGMPDVQSKAPFILPVDANPATVTINGYPLELVYANLEKLNIQKAYVFLDACFSGGSNNKMLIQQASPVFVSANIDTGTKFDKLTILAASDGDQLASWDDREGHGLFTEYVLKGLAQAPSLAGDGELTATELHKYVLENVRRQARRIYGREQTPVLIGDANAEIYKVK